MSVEPTSIKEEKQELSDKAARSILNYYKPEVVEALEKFMSDAQDDFEIETAAALLIGCVRCIRSDVLGANIE